MLSKKTIHLFLPALLVLVSCSSKDEKKDTEKPPVRVEILTVAGQGFENTRDYSGTLQEGESTTLSFSAAGTIKQLKVQQGDRVAQGQIIGTLDDASLKSAYEIANATLAQAQDAYDRMKILHDANSLPEIKWVDIKQKLVQAQNAADIARNALDDAVLRAPFAGMIADKMADVGQVAAPGVPVVKLVNISNIKAVISVPQNQISQFSEGDKAMITLNGDNDTQLEGILVEKGVTANPLSRAYDVKYRIPNNGNLLPGMICNVAVPRGNESSAIMLPQSVVLLDERNNNFVWIDSAGTARKRIVVVDELNDGGLEITSGLVPGDKVIVKGIQKVCNGTKLEPVNK